MQAADELSLYRYDLVSGKATQCWGLSGQQYLFSSVVFDHVCCNSTAACDFMIIKRHTIVDELMFEQIHGGRERLCIQDDVNGLVIELGAAGKLAHTQTLNAFGFISLCR